jgi:enoyl-CoA hydratase
MTEKNEPTYEKIIYEKKGEVVWLTLNDEKRFNCMSMKMQDELIDVLGRIEVDDTVKCVVLTGAGDASFSSGGDLTHFDTFFDPATAYNYLRNYFYKIQTLITNTEKVFIAAINGLCLAGGLEVSLCCDFRIASEKAQTGVLEVNLGVIPGGGGFARCAKFLPLSKAKELLMTGDMIDAQEAHRLFLFDKVVPHEKLYDEVNEFTDKICSKPFTAIRRIKTGVNKAAETPGMDVVLEIERGLAMHLSQTEDFKEAVAAFMEKRKPKFKDC